MVEKTNTYQVMYTTPRVSSRQQRALYPFSHRRAVDKISYLVPLLQEAYLKRAFSGGSFVATHPNPAIEDVYRVCRPCFVFTHANPRASGCVGTSGTGGRTDTARRATVVVTPRPPVRSTGRYSRNSTCRRIASPVKQKRLRAPCSFGHS